MVTELIYHFLMIPLIAGTAFFMYIAREKVIPVIIGLIGGLMGFLIEWHGINNTLYWSWSTPADFLVATVPFLVILTYFFGAMTLSAIYFYVTDEYNVKNGMRTLYFIFIPYGIIYAFYAADPVLLTFILGVSFFCKVVKSHEILLTALLVPVMDTISENILISNGILIVDYGPGYYMGMFIGGFLLLTLSEYLLQRKSEKL